MVDIEPGLTDEFADYMRMWSKRYLQRVRATIHTIGQLRSEIAELDEMVDGISAIDYSADHVSGTADDDAMANAIVRRDSLKAELQSELDACLNFKADAHRALSKVRQPWRAVLTYRYVEGKAWADVTKQLNGMEGNHYAEVYVRKEMHDNGLLELYQFVPHDEIPEAI